jgi:hypothetical protein
MDTQIYDLIRSSTAEFREVFRTSPWQVHVFQFDWSSVKTTGRAIEVPIPKMHELRHCETRNDDEAVGRAAAATALLHCAVVGVRAADLDTDAKRALEHTDGVSICSFPIQHPWAFQANPGTPLLLGAASFVGPLTVIDAIKDYRLTILGEKYSELIAVHLAKDERSSSYPPEVFLAKSIEVDGRLFTFDLDSRLTDIASFPLAYERITDTENVDWYEFSPGLRASVVSLMEYRFYRDRIGKSRAYMKQLDDELWTAHSSQ